MDGSNPRSPIERERGTIVEKRRMDIVGLRRHPHLLHDVARRPVSLLKPDCGVMRLVAGIGRIRRAMSFGRPLALFLRIWLLLFLRCGGWLSGSPASPALRGRPVHRGVTSCSVVAVRFHNLTRDGLYGLVDAINELRSAIVRRSWSRPRRQERPRRLHRGIVARVVALSRSRPFGQVRRTPTRRSRQPTVK